MVYTDFKSFLIMWIFLHVNSFYILVKYTKIKQDINEMKGE